MRKYYLQPDAEMLELDVDVLVTSTPNKGEDPFGEDKVWEEQ